MKYNDYFAVVPRLETKRLVLRAFTREDMDAYLEFMHDPQVQRYLSGGVSLFHNEPHISNWLRNINGRLLKSKTVLTWCIMDKKQGTVIGRIDLGGFVKKTMAEIAYYISPAEWGRGMATEAVAEVVRFGFEKLKLHRIQATVLPENSASLRVLAKAGFTKEGVLRKFLIGKEFHDTVMLAAVREDNLNQ
jgi:[ribosomal protein S5]-alanine N-acetyltransferase